MAWREKGGVVSDLKDENVEQEESWSVDFHNLAVELGIPYEVIYAECERTSMHRWRAKLTILKHVSLGYGTTRSEAKNAACRNAFPWLRLQDEAVLKRKSRSSQMGAVRLERGFQSESAVLRALSDPTIQKPLWFRSVRRATADEQPKGIDVVVESDVGPLFLQVKSSQLFAQRFKQKRRPSMIGLIVATHLEDPYEIYRRAMDILTYLYDRVRERRRRSDAC